MKDNADNGGLIVAIGLSLIALLLIGGIGVYFFVGRQQMAMQAERARMAEAEARIAAEHARAAAEASLASRTTSLDESGSTGQDDSIRAAIESMLRAQADAWNQGNLEAFMEHYWKSDALSFSSGGKTTRGWMETLNGYRERYPTTERMGRVTFEGLEITPLGDSAALVLGQWNLQRDGDPVSGNFSLVLRKLGDRWLIIHDHTSRLMD